MKNSYSLASLLLLLALQLVGCSGQSSDAPGLIKVTGTVTKGGQPAENWSVAFYPQSKGGPSYGTTDAAGKFTLVYTDGRPGATEDMHSVSISETPPSTPDPDAQSGGDPPPSSQKPPIEKRFEATVNADSNTFEFSLD